MKIDKKENVAVRHRKTVGFAEYDKVNCEVYL